MRRLVYTDFDEAVPLIDELEARGEDYVVLCPDCGAELVVALTLEASRKHGVHPGVYCPVDPKHVSDSIELGEVHERFMELFRPDESGEPDT